MVSHRLHLLLGTLLFYAASTSVFAKSSLEGMRNAMASQRQRINELQERLGHAQGDGQDGAFSKREAPIAFSNPKAKEFYVDGTTIPDVKFDAGPSWAGLMPISGAKNETRKLFFWFWPTNNASNVKDLLFWTNGGPGCSSLEGFLQENGPISWSWGQSEPTPNPYSWTNLSNVLWVEQPVGTGFSQGVPDISNDDELAAQVAGFLEQFLEVFGELKGSNFYVSGESYAGYYVPYIANYLYENPNPDLSLKGIWIADPTISWFLLQSEIPALRFVQANKNVIPFNTTFLAQLQNVSDACGFTDYLDKVTYPPTGLLPLPAGAFLDDDGSVNYGDDCEIWSLIVDAASQINPVFDIYRVTDAWPSPWSVLGFPQSTQQFIYFNRQVALLLSTRARTYVTSQPSRTDVQRAIHAPQIDWDICADQSVYVGLGDTSVPPAANNVLPNVIEKSERTAIIHGLEDFILIAEGTRIAIQNMTWNGKQGFQTPIEEQSFLVDDMGVYGNYHTERGLTYVEFYFSGHMTPQFVPWAAYQTIAYVLGKRESPSA